MKRHYGKHLEEKEIRDHYRKLVKQWNLEDAEKRKRETSEDAKNMAEIFTDAFTGGEE